MSMSMFGSLLPPEFLPEFLAGMIVNFQIAGVAIAIGLAVGLLFALARVRGGVAGAVVAPIVSLMRAAPTFVLMFFFLNALPQDSSFQISGLMIVALSLVPYSAAFVADSGVDAIRDMRVDSRHGALLFLPNVTRAFFVLVMSSSAGAAIGVPEGITVILRHTEHLPTLGDKLLMFAIGIVLFSIPLQAGFALLNLVRRRLAG